VQQVQTLLEWAENTGFVKGRKVDRPDATLIGAHKMWAEKAKHTQKTKDQYGKDQLRTLLLSYTRKRQDRTERPEKHRIDGFSRFDHALQEAGEGPEQRLKHE
jgi:hypothetical protein